MGKIRSLLSIALLIAVLFTACTEHTNKDPEDAADQLQQTEPVSSEEVDFSAPEREGSVELKGIRLQASCADGSEAIRQRHLEGLNDLENQQYEFSDLLADPVPLITAPGEMGDYCVAALSGTAEADLLFSLSIENVREPFLKAGTYTDYTELARNAAGEYGYFKTFTTGDYYPLRWDLVFYCKDGSELQLSSYSARKAGINGFSLLDPEGYTAFKLALDAVFPELERRNPGLRYCKIGDGSEGSGLSPGSLYFSGGIEEKAEMNLRIVLRWSWAFESDTDMSEVEIHDRADTLLGNLTAQAVTPEQAGVTVPDGWGTDCYARVEYTLYHSRWVK